MCIGSVYDTVMKKITYKRVNITLPESTVAMLATVANNGERSTFIDTAIKKYVDEIRKQDLREQIKEGSIARAERNLQMAQEWSHLEDEVWQKYL